MRKLLTIITALTVSGTVIAGGLVTNTNQSALFTRLQSRNASTGIDAVYFNPAGLTKLDDGFHLSLNNQTIGQKKTVNTSYPYLTTSPKDYEGKVSAPFFPGVYAAYKTGKLAFSLGFNPIGGGGGATYEAGLPSFEMKIADLVPLLAYQLTAIDEGVLLASGSDPHFRNITGYAADIYFKGSSTYLGVQLNASYMINEMFSVALGARVVSATNKYSGYIENVTITTPAPYGGVQSPGDYLRTVATVVTSQATQLNGTAAYLDDATTVNADAVMKGIGFAPVISVNVTPNEMFNIALKYEFKTKLELTTTVKDGNDAEGMFIQDSVATADMPAMLALGVDATPLPGLLVSGSFNYYFDKGVDYDGQDDIDLNKIDKNFLEFGLGAQYDINDKLCASIGWLSTITGVNNDYQSDITYSLNTNTFGGGVGYKINEMVGINLGGSYTIYNQGFKSYLHGTPLGSLVPAGDIYNKNTWIVAIGVDLHF